MSEEAIETAEEESELLLYIQPPSVKEQATAAAVGIGVTALAYIAIVGGVALYNRSAEGIREWRINRAAKKLAKKAEPIED